MTAKRGASLAVPARQILPGAVDGELEHQVGERREMVGEPLDRQQPGEILGEQAEYLRLVHLAQHVHAPLGVAGALGEPRAQRRARTPARSGGAYSSRSSSSSSSSSGWRVMNSAAQLDAPMMRATRSSASGMLGEQREVGGAAGDRLEQRDAAHQRRFRHRACSAAARASAGTSASSRRRESSGSAA